MRDRAARRAAGAFVLVAFGALAAFATACAPGGADGPQGRVEASCQARCGREASRKCSEHDCDRGCRFILDRLVEREGPHVVACVARAKTCDDAAWADCAAQVGPHADGGPPAPAPSEEEW